MAYSDVISLGEAGADVPREVQQLIAADIAKQSTVLSLGTKVPVSTKDSKIRFSSTRPRRTGSPPRPVPAR